jgi:hypothetical protein
LASSEIGGRFAEMRVLANSLEHVEVAVIGLVLVVGIAVLIAGIRATIDAANLPESAFKAAGANRSLWIILPLVGLSLGVPGLIATVWWFARTKPKVTAAMVDGPASPNVNLT